MTGEFLDSWSLFGDTYLAAWLIATLLSLVGVWVVARDQIFLGAAVSQASTLGTALALWIQGAALGHSLGGDGVTFLFAVLASVATALLSSRHGGSGRESPEAITGWIFLIGGSVPVIMMAHDPHGLEEVHRLLFSSILGASRTDVVIFAALLAATAVVALRLHRPLILFAMDPEMAAAVGLRRSRWQAGTSVALGLAVGLSVHSAGMIYSFGCLVLPALIARNLCREVVPMLWVAPIIGLTVAVTAFVLSNSYDVPPAQMTVALLCAVYGLAWGVRAARA